jgi:hypothetical protein
MIGRHRACSQGGEALIDVLYTPAAQLGRALEGPYAMGVAPDSFQAPGGLCMPSSTRRRSWLVALPALLSSWPLQALADDEVTFRTISRAVVSSNGDRLDYLVARSKADWDKA